MIPRLITKAEQQEAAGEVLGSRFTHHGQVFLPSDKFYKKPLGSSDLRAMHRELCHWLGIPPSHLEVRFSASSTNYHPKQSLLIKSRLKQKPTVCAAIIARRLARMSLEHKNILPANPSQAAVMIDYFTVSYGLGLLMINGYGESHGLARFANMHEDFSRKNYLSSRAYVREFVNYTHRFHLDIAEWGGFVTPRGRKLLPRVLAHTAARASRRPAEVRKLDSNHQKFMLKFAGVILILFMISASLIFLQTQRVQYLPKDLAEQREKIDMLRNMYQQCSGAVLEEKSITNQNNYFIARSTEADQNRCVSLRNKYNYEVDQYNQAIKNLD